MYYTCIAASGAESLWKDQSMLMFSDVCVCAVRGHWCVCVCACRHLGGEVSVEDALAVQVLQSPGDVQSQAEPQAPRQVHVAAQQLLQVAAVDVLDHQWKAVNYTQIKAQWVQCILKLLGFLIMKPLLLLFWEAGTQMSHWARLGLFNFLLLLPRFIDGFTFI